MDVKEKQKFIALFGIFAAAGIMLYYNLLLRPQFMNFLAASRELSSLNLSVTQARALINSKDKISAQRDDLKKGLETIESRLPSHGEISTLLEDFSDVAKSSGVKILKIKPMEPAPGSDIGKAYIDFPIVIEAAAGYHRCGAFVSALESMRSFIKVENVDIKGQASEPREHYIKLRVKTYVAR